MSALRSNNRFRTDVYGKNIIDPFAGDGRLLKMALECSAANVIGVEIRKVELPEWFPKRKDSHWYPERDAFDPELWTWNAGSHVMVTNHPYSLGGDGLLQCIEKVFVSWALLPLSYLRPAEFRRWIPKIQPDLHILRVRPSFTGDGGTAATEYAWFRWPGTGKITWEG